MSVNIISRSEWGARPWNGSPAYVPLSSRTEFFVHWFGGVPNNSTGAALAREVERLHMDGNGWAGVGYNFIVDQNGAIYEGRGWTKTGAHCPGHNTSGIGVLIAVGKGGEKASEKALAAARALYDEACRKTGRTLAKRGHKDGFNTECPGPELYAWVKAGMPAGDYDTPDAPAPEPEKPASWDGTSFPGAGAFVLGQSHPAVTVLGQRLVAHGYGRFYQVGPGPRFSEADKDATQAFQKAQGWTGSDADGYPGPSTWSRLMAAPKVASSIVSLSSGVKPGARHTQVKELQKLLVKAGYGPIPGAYTTYYGPETQKAVARFHNKNLHLKSAGVSYDPAIGKKGFVELQKEAGRK